MGFEEKMKTQFDHCEGCRKWLPIDYLSGYPGKDGHLDWYCHDCLIKRMDELDPYEAIKGRLEKLDEMIEKVDRLAEEMKGVSMDIRHVYSAKERR